MPSAATRERRSPGRNGPIIVGSLNEVLAGGQRGGAPTLTRSCLNNIAERVAANSSRPAQEGLPLIDSSAGLHAGLSSNEGVSGSAPSAAQGFSRSDARRPACLRDALSLRCALTPACPVGPRRSAGRGELQADRLRRGGRRLRQDSGSRGRHRRSRDGARGRGSRLRSPWRARSARCGRR